MSRYFFLLNNPVGWHGIMIDCFPFGELSLMIVFSSSLEEASTSHCAGRPLYPWPTACTVLSLFFQYCFETHLLCWHHVPPLCSCLGLSRWLSGKESACDVGSTPGSGKSPGGGMATHSSILAWEIPWTEEPGGCSPWGHRESDTAEWLSIVSLKVSVIFSCTQRPPTLRMTYRYTAQGVSLVSHLWCWCKWHSSASQEQLGCVMRCGHAEITSYALRAITFISLYAHFFLLRFFHIWRTHFHQ